jgi:MFS family permease
LLTAHLPGPRRTGDREMSAAEESRDRETQSRSDGGALQVSRDAVTYAALWTPALLQLLAAAATWGFANACFVLLPKYLAVELGVGAREIGRTMGAFGIASVPMAGVAGVVVDRRPYRVSIASGAVLLALSAIGFAGVHAFGPHVYVLRAIQALANALIVTAVGVAVVEITPPARHAQAVGLTGAIMLAMNAVAPVAAEPLAAVAGWTAVFVLAATAAVASLCFLVGMRGGGHRPIRSSAAEARYRGDPRLAIEYAAVSAAAGLAYGTVMAFQQPLALAHGRSDVGTFLAAFAAGALGLRLFAGSLPDRIGRDRAAFGALAAYAVGTAALGVTPARYMDALGLFLGLAHGLFFPALNVLMLSRVPRSHRGRALALFTASFHFGVAGTALLGPIAATRGYPTVFAAAGAMTALGAMLLSTSRTLREPQPQVSILASGASLATSPERAR